MARDNLILDPQIRYWVILPVLIVTFLFGIIRHYLTQLLRSDKKSQSAYTLKTGQLLRKSAVLRENGRFLPANSFLIRKQYLTGDEGPLTVGMNTEGTARNPMQDPTQMGDMMKGQVMNILPMMVMGGWVSFTFSGFLTARVPFSLTYRFKQLLQRGIDLPSLDASWISSMSWYIIIAFGMRGMYGLVLGQDNQADQARIMQQQMPGGAMGPVQDEQKAFKAEWEGLKLVEYRNALQNVEKALLET